MAGVAVVLVFLLANSCIGQNSESIELYFLFYFRIDCGCGTDNTEPSKIEDRTNQPRSDRSKPLSDRSDSRCASVICYV